MNEFQLIAIKEINLSLTIHVRVHVHCIYCICNNYLYVYSVLTCQSISNMYKPEALAPSISATYWRDSSIIALASIPLNKQF